MTDELELIEVYSARDDVEEGRSSLFWKDIERELAAWLKGFETEEDNIVDNAAEENPSTASVLLHLGDLNGRKKAIMYMLGLPDMLLQIIDDQKSEDKEDG